MPKNTKNFSRYSRELINVISSVTTNRALLRQFLIDLLTPQEYHELSIRWQIVKQLAQSVPQRQIAKNLGVSVATITRGSRTLQNPKGGFNQVLSQLKNWRRCRKVKH